MKVIIGVLAAILFIDLCSLWLQSAVTSVAVVPEVKTIGAWTPVEVQVTNPHGVRRVTAWLEQGGSRFKVFQEESPAHWWRWKRDQPPTRVRFDTGKEKVPELREGKARLLIEAVGDDFRGASARSAYEVTIMAAQIDKSEQWDRAPRFAGTLRISPVEPASVSLPPLFLKNVTQSFVLK